MKHQAVYDFLKISQTICGDNSKKNGINPDNYNKKMKIEYTFTEKFYLDIKKVEICTK